MSSPLLFVLFDGINNSVFKSQVINPLKIRTKKKPGQPIMLVSFEKQKPTFKNISGIPVHILNKSRHRKNVRALQRILFSFPSYELIARGPIAGLICLHARDRKKCHKLTIQARGLLAQEYAYTHRKEKSPFMRFLYWMRRFQLKRIERTVFRTNKETNVVIEAVSPALKEYLVTEFKTSPNKITIAKDDIPEIIPAQQIKDWQKAIRKKLGIPRHYYVYCYNGSAKPWQCPQQTILFFQQQLQKNPERYLLIVSQDKKNFESIIKQYDIPSHLYAIHSVEHHNVYEYLSACNAGLIFREKHIINWISRPTKVLEYRAVGLEIIHNKTIHYISNI